MPTPKPYPSRIECHDSICESADPTEIASVETAYRRGAAHATARILEALRRGVDLRSLIEWEQELLIWRRYSDNTRPLPIPKIRKIRR